MSPASATSPGDAEARYRALVDSAADAIVTADLSGTITAWNASAERIFGFTAAEAVGGPITMLMPVRYREQHPGAIAGLREGGERRVIGSVVELEGLRRDGSEFPIELSLAKWQVGDEQYVTAIIRDLTRRVRAEAGLRESEARYRGLFEGNRAVILLVDPESGALIDANPAACAWYGWSRDEFLAMNISDVNTLSPAEVHAEMADALALRRRAFNFRHRRADGTIRDVEVYSGPIELGGRSVLYSIVFDVTERREAEAALRESEAMRDVAERVARVGSFRRDLDPVDPRATWSRGMFDLFDIDPDGFDGDLLRVLAERVHPDDRAEVLRAGVSVAAGDAPAPAEFRVLRRDGSERIVHTESTLERDAAGTPLALTGYYQDVTEQRIAESVRRGTEQKILRVDRLYATLSGVNRAIVHAGSREEMFEAICRVAVGEGGFRMAWAGLIGADDGRVAPVAVAGHEDGYLTEIRIINGDASTGSGPTGRAISEGRCIVCHDVASDPRMAPWRTQALARGYRSSASVPVRQAGNVVGAFTVYADEPGAFGTEEEALLEEAGRDISFALDSLHAAEAVRRSEAMRDTAEHTARIGSFRWDLRGGESAWSPEIYELFEINHGEFGGSLNGALDGRVHPDDLEGLQAAVAAVPESGWLPPHEFRLRRRDGGERVVVGGGTCERDGADRVTALVGYVQDVTEQRRAEQELRLAYERLDIAQQAAGAGAFQFHADTRKFTFSPQMHELFGLDHEADPGTFDTLRSVVHPDDVETTWEAYASALRDHAPLRAEYRIIRPSDGEVRWIDSLGHGVYDAAGRPLSLIGLCIDVTGRKQTETLLGVPSEILTILAEGGHVEEMARKIVDAVQRASGFSAVGLRLRDGDDYPFIAATGYEAGFIDAEDSLTSPAPGGGLCREADGSVSLDCTCGLVIRGPATPGDPLFTPGGSIWTNDCKAAVEALSDDDPRLRPRDRCVHVGFCSVALVPVRAGDQILGLLHLADDGTDCFTPESIRFFEGLGASIGNALLRRQAEDDLEESTLELRGQLSDTVKAMGAIVGLRDPYTAAHEHRVTLLALAMAEQLGLDEERREGLALAGEVHDIGKIAVPAEILTKPSRLSPVEFTLISMHAETGREILSEIHFGQPVADIVAQHHERLDGSGYPDGLRGDQILPEAKILAVADVVEAMASHRPYRPGLGLDAALDEVRSGAGVKYDAAAVEACERVFSAGFSFPEE